MRIIPFFNINLSIMACITGISTESKERKKAWEKQVEIVAR